MMKPNTGGCQPLFSITPLTGVQGVVPPTSSSGSNAPTKDCFERHDRQLHSAFAELESPHPLLKIYLRNIATEPHFPDAADVAEGIDADWRQLNHVGLNRLQRRSQEGIKCFFPA